MLAPFIEMCRASGKECQFQTVCPQPGTWVEWVPTHVSDQWLVQGPTKKNCFSCRAADKDSYFSNRMKNVLSWKFLQTSPTAGTSSRGWECRLLTFPFTSWGCQDKKEKSRLTAGVNMRIKIGNFLTMRWERSKSFSSSDWCLCLMSLVVVWTRA